MLRRRLAKLKTDEAISMTTFLRQVQELVNEFACAGEVVDNRELVEHTLLALPASYEGLVNTIMYRKRLPSFADITVLLMEEDLRRDLRNPKRIDSEALLVRSAGCHFANRRPGTNNEDYGTKIKKVGATCHYCGKLDHWMKHCPELAAEVKRRRANRIEKPSLNVVDS